MKPCINPLGPAVVEEFVEQKSSTCRHIFGWNSCLYRYCYSTHAMLSWIEQVI